MNCGTCTCNKHKMSVFFLPANLILPEPAHTSDASPTMAVNKLFPASLKKGLHRTFIFIPLPFILSEKNTCIHSHVNKNQEIFLDTLNDFGEVYTRNLQHSVSRNMKYSLVSAMCWLSNYYIHMSTNDLSAWEIYHYIQSITFIFIYLLKSIKKWTHF